MKMLHLFEKSSGFKFQAGGWERGLGRKMICDMGTEIIDSSHMKSDHTGNS